MEINNEHFGVTVSCEVGQTNCHALYGWIAVEQLRSVQLMNGASADNAAGTPQTGFRDVSRTPQTPCEYRLRFLMPFAPLATVILKAREH